jgi:hypothetical protein
VSSFSLLPASGGFSQFTACFWWFLAVFCLLLVSSFSFLPVSGGTSQFASYFCLVLLLGLILDFEDGGDMILRNVRLFPTNTALQPHRPL